jgi:NSS family neurotransmitter:Na+ symporter
MEQGTKHTKREAWVSRWGFILACIGSAVGMGNIWLFPSRVANYGGAFLLAYLLFSILIGYSGVVGEMALGRKAKEGPVGAFRQAFATREKGKLGAAIGTIPMIGALLLAIGYSVVVGWIFRYVSLALTGGLTSLGSDVSDVSAFAQLFGDTAQTFGNNSWLIIGLLVTFIITTFGVVSGIEKANKIMIPIFFCLFVGLVIYVAMQPGASEGYRYMFTIEKDKLFDPMMWVYALGQSFFSLSLAGNGTVIYGSYLSDEEDIVASAGKVAMFDTLAAVLASLVIVPSMAAAGTTQFSGGPGLMFIYLPNLFASMPGGALITVIFFVAVLLAGLTSLVNLFEAPIATLQDSFHFSRAASVTTVGTIGMVVAIFIQGIVSDWMDFVSIYICPLGAGIAGVAFAWVWGKKAVLSEVSKGRKRPVGDWYFYLYKYGFCILTLLVFLLGVVCGGIG